MEISTKFMATLISIVIFLVTPYGILWSINALLVNSISLFNPIAITLETYAAMLVLVLIYVIIIKPAPPKNHKCGITLNENE